MCLVEREVLVFEDVATGHRGELRVADDICRYFYYDAEPIWIMNISKVDAEARLATGEWVLYD